MKNDYIKKTKDTPINLIYATRKLYQVSVKDLDWLHWPAVCAPRLHCPVIIEFSLTFSLLLPDASRKNGLIINLKNKTSSSFVDCVPIHVSQLMQGSFSYSCGWTMRFDVLICLRPTSTWNIIIKWWWCSFRDVRYAQILESKHICSLFDSTNQFDVQNPITTIFCRRSQQKIFGYIMENIVGDHKFPKSMRFRTNFHKYHLKTPGRDAIVFTRFLLQITCFDRKPKVDNFFSSALCRLLLFIIPKRWKTLEKVKFDH